MFAVSTIRTWTSAVFSPRSRTKSSARNISRRARPRPRKAGSTASRPIAAATQQLGDDAGDRLFLLDRQESAAGRELLGNRRRGLDEDARFRLQHAAIFGEGPAHDLEHQRG